MLEEIYGLEHILTGKMDTNINDAKCAIIEIKAESIEPTTLISKPQSCYEHSQVEIGHEVERAVTIKDEKYEDSFVPITTQAISNTGIAPNDINIKLDLSDSVDSLDFCSNKEPDEQNKGSKDVDKPIDNFDISDDERYKCKICSKHFKTRKTLFAHSKIHDGREYVCEICDKRFTTRRYLFNHVKTHTSTERNYKCKICDKCFFTKKLLLCHSHTHDYALKEIINAKFALNASHKRNNTFGHT